jgi:hypothetical protein
MGIGIFGRTGRFVAGCATLLMSFEKWPSLAMYAFAYDNTGRLIGTSTQYAFLPGHNFQNSYSYDVASNRTSLTTPDGSTNSTMTR